MRPLFLLGLALVLLVGCGKEKGGRVDIYMLRSFKLKADTSRMPSTHSITEAVLEGVPLVADGDILYYNKSTTTFKLAKDIKPVIKNYGPDRAFAVTVNGQPVYYGRFQPAWMSSVIYGIATIDPVLMADNELPIKFLHWDGNLTLQQLDRRNDSRIIDALKASGRIR